MVIFNYIKILSEKKNFLFFYWQLTIIFFFSSESKTILEKNIKETRESILEKNIKIEKRVIENEQKISILLEHTTEIDEELLNLIKDTNKLKKYAKDLQKQRGGEEE